MDDEETLDTSWIDRFEKEETYYSMFYPEEIKELRVSILYINTNKEIERICEKLITLKNKNEIQKEELLALIKQNEIMDKTKYKLVSLLVYNLTLNHDELKNFLRSDKEYSFMTSLKHIDTYKMDATINCLHEINNLFIVFNEEDTKTTAHTKRISFNLVHGKTRKKKQK